MAPDHPKRRLSDNWYVTWSKICGSILATAGVIGIIWAKLAVPEIDKRIELQTNPIIETMEFQNFLIMEQMPAEKVKAAEDKYTSYRRARVGIKK